jgi:hypothetical protein
MSKVPNVVMDNKVVAVLVVDSATCSGSSMAILQTIKVTIETTKNLRMTVNFSIHSFIHSEEMEYEEGKEDMVYYHPASHMISPCQGIKGR